MSYVIKPQHRITALFLAPIMVNVPTSVATSAEVISIEKKLNNRDDISVYLNPTRELRNEILDFFETRSYDGWDGYNATPISKESLSTALKIIDHLPKGIQKPDVVPHAGGGYSFEWQLPNKIFSMEIEQNEITCVFLDQAAKKKSSSYDMFDNKLPILASLFLSSEFKA